MKPATRQKKEQKRSQSDSAVQRQKKNAQERESRLSLPHGAGLFANSERRKKQPRAQTPRKRTEQVEIPAHTAEQLCAIAEQMQLVQSLTNLSENLAGAQPVLLAQLAPMPDFTAPALVNYQSILQQCEDLHEDYLVELERIVALQTPNLMGEAQSDYISQDDLAKAIAKETKGVAQAKISNWLRQACIEIAQAEMQSDKTQRLVQLSGIDADEEHANQKFLFPIGQTKNLIGPIMLAIDKKPVSYELIKQGLQAYFAKRKVKQIPYDSRQGFVRLAIEISKKNKHVATDEKKQQSIEALVELFRQLYQDFGVDCSEECYLAICLQLPGLQPANCMQIQPQQVLKELLALWVVENVARSFRDRHYQVLLANGIGEKIIEIKNLDNGDITKTTKLTQQQSFALFYSCFKIYFNQMEKKLNNDKERSAKGEVTELLAEVYLTKFQQGESLQQCILEVLRQAKEKKLIKSSVGSKAQKGTLDETGLIGILAVLNETYAILLDTTGVEKARCQMLSLEVAA